MDFDFIFILNFFNLTNCYRTRQLAMKNKFDKKNPDPFIRVYPNTFIDLPDTIFRVYPLVIQNLSSYICYWGKSF